MVQYLHDPFVCKQNAKRQNRQRNDQIQHGGACLQDNQNSNSIFLLTQGINDTDTLIYKYLNKEAVYGDLLGRITQNEQKIQELKEEQEQLIKEQRELEMEKDTIQNIKIKTTDITRKICQLFR